MHESTPFGLSLAQDGTVGVGGPNWRVTGFSWTSGAAAMGPDFSECAEVEGSCDSVPESIFFFDYFLKRTFFKHN